jgi:type IV secretory pathway ATPase VirB11/archaellum biosynthesis ATPase
MPPVAVSDEELVDAIRFLGQNAQPSRPFDDAHPTMTLALGERFRLHAIGFGLSHRPSVVIRQHTLTDVSLADLAAGGLMPWEVAQFLDSAILARRSMVISGDQGAGKTTLLRALISSIPLNERFGTLETDYELMAHLQPGRENILALQARVGHGETSGGSRIGDFTISDLMPEALRQNLSRIIVGEVRGGEAAAMFEAMQAGTGTLSTTHSHSGESTIDRLASRVAQGGVLTVDEAYRQIAHNISLFIHVRLVDETWKGGIRRRYISEIRQVTRAMENGRPVTHLTYTADGSSGQAAGFYPDADFEAELLPFRRELQP